MKAKNRVSMLCMYKFEMKTYPPFQKFQNCHNVIWNTLAKLNCKNCVPTAGVPKMQQYLIMFPALEGNTSWKKYAAKGHQKGATFGPCTDSFIKF